MSTGCSTSCTILAWIRSRWHSVSSEKRWWWIDLGIHDGDTMAVNFTYGGFWNKTNHTGVAGKLTHRPLSITVNPANNRVTGTGVTYENNGNLTVMPNNLLVNQNCGQLVGR